MTATSIVAYLLLFASVGFLFLFVALLLGRFIRPNKPNAEKLAIYECGEPSVGSSRVRYDLRFYVVALVFLVLDVEVAFFFPWATVFGKSAQLMAPNAPQAVASEMVKGETTATVVTLAPNVAKTYRELGVSNPTLPSPMADAAQNTALIRAEGRSLARTAMVDMAIFFGVILVGFAYVWWRGDLDWVRTYQKKEA